MKIRQARPGTVRRWSGPTDVLRKTCRLRPVQCITFVWKKRLKSRVILPRDWGVFTGPINNINNQMKKVNSPFKLGESFRDNPGLYHINMNDILTYILKGTGMWWIFTYRKYDYVIRYNLIKKDISFSFTVKIWCKIMLLY